MPNKVQVGDMGIDGRIFPVGSKPADQHSMFAGDWFPVQVKQMDKVGRPDIDAFEAVMAREERARGFFVAFGFTADAEAECAAFHKKPAGSSSSSRCRSFWTSSMCRRCEGRVPGGGSGSCCFCG